MRFFYKRLELLGRLEGNSEIIKQEIIGLVFRCRNRRKKKKKFNS